MNRLRQVLPARGFLFALLVAAGCSDGTGPHGDSHFSGRWAGTDWVGDAEALFVSGGPGTDTLYVFGVRPRNAEYPLETISVRVPFQGPGSYELPGDAVEFVVLTGGDVVEAQYNGHSPTAGTLEVSSYEAATGLITGTVAFDADAMSQFQPYGPAARFDGGRFRANVRRSQ
jgi:hypothetical protein